MSSKSRFVRVVFLCAALVLSVFTPALPATAATDQLPDLGLARVRDIRIVKPGGGLRLLRFTTTIVNVGSGSFELRGQRPDTNTALMSTTQRIYDDAGGYRDVATSATMFFAGDGHNHWHVSELENYELIRMDNGSQVGTGVKVGFCFYDGNLFSNLPGTPASPVYNGCGRQSNLSVVMGLSTGWADTYPWSHGLQYIDITGLKAGRYRLQVTADENGWFQEANESNNVTWVDIRLHSKNGTRFTIVAYGPSQ